MRCRCAILIVLIACHTQYSIAKSATDTFRIHSDLPVINNDEKIVLDVCYSADTVFKAAITIQFYKYNSRGDSLLVLSSRREKFLFKKGINKTRLNFNKEDSGVYYNPDFYEILKKIKNIPPGIYKTLIAVHDSSKSYHSVYVHEVDTMLSAGSPLRKDINKSLQFRPKSFLGIRMQKGIKQAASTGGGTALMNMKSKADKAIRKRGLTSVHHEQNNKSYIDLYYQDWFAGRYEVKNNSSLSRQIEQEESNASAPNLNTAASGNFNSPSLLSQYKTLNKEKKDNDEITGEISLNTNVSSGQEQYSDVDNNYYELRGRVELPVMGIPVEMEGYYTSQDNHRQIKSSYFHINYDVDKMKSDLSKSISSYNTKFSETQSKSMGMTQIYQASLSKLEGQRARLQGEISAEVAKGTHGTANNGNITRQVTGDLQKNIKDTTGLAKEMRGSKDTADTAADTTGNDPSAKEKAAKAKEEALAKEKRLDAKRKQLEELEKKIAKYQQLLSQHKTTSYFDSSLGYAKTKDVSSYNNMSYKQLSKKGSNMLPDGQAKGFIAGLTNLDAGMFPKYTSQYTMGGQMMKGLDIGYDLGFCEAGATVGKTEYIGRDGNLDKYTCYSGRAAFKPAKEQKVSLIYYGYSADRKMYQGDGFFNNVNISAPGFFEPVHIFSLRYDGAVSKYVTIGAETATSLKSADKTDVPVIPMSEKMAYHFNAEGNIPNTTVSLEGAYDKTGKGFENNTLPISMSGTEQYRLAGRSDFFHSLLTLGVDYNRLAQYNFSTNSISTKWGFDVKTNFKRYPNMVISYKPFTTFHSYTDTLNIPQRPLLGEVWTAKATYQFKKHDKSYRFLVLYNRSTTTTDTFKYGSDLMQASFMYSDKAWSGSVNAGHMQVSGTATLNPTTPNNTDFVSFSASYALSKQLSITGGQDFGMASFGFCKYGSNGGLMYKPQKKPFIIRLNVRFNDYKLNVGESWKQLYSGNIDITYRFKAKIKDNRQ